jgi:hypothetical protein
VIQLAARMGALLAVQPGDSRKCNDGLAAVCRSVIEPDPFSGFIVLCRNRGKTTIKLITYDGQGFRLFQKRPSAGKLHSWPGHEEQAVRVLAVHELQLLIWNGDPSSARVAGAQGGEETGTGRRGAA